MLDYKMRRDSFYALFWVNVIFNTTFEIYAIKSFNVEARICWPLKKIQAYLDKVKTADLEQRDSIVDGMCGPSVSQLVLSVH
jgi:hypothetical protein